MTTSCQNFLNMKRGDSWTKRFYWVQDANNGVDGETVPLQLELQNAIFSIKEIGSGTVIVVADMTLNTVILNSELGYLDVFVSSVETLEMDQDTYICELELLFVDGIVQSTPGIYIKVYQDIAHNSSPYSTWIAKQPNYVY